MIEGIDVFKDDVFIYMYIYIYEGSRMESNTDKNRNFAGQDSITLRLR